MVEFGYKLSSEEHPPLELVRQATLAEVAGFDFAMMSDHFHPWIDRQGESPFAWGVLGAIAQATERLRLGTGVTCPTVRVHPAAEDEAAARRTALEWWPNAGIEGELPAELPLPRHFEQAARAVTEDSLAEKVVCGPDPDRHIEMARTYLEAGYDHLWFHQIGPEQDGFFRFYERSVLPKLR
jgi:hypothetical protein